MTKELKSQQEREININGNEIITKFRQIIKGIFDREGTFTDEDINTLKSILNSENLSEGERESLEKELLDHLEAHLDKLRITNPLEIPGNNISTVKANSFLPRKNDTDDPQEREREFSVLERPINMRVPPIFIDAVRKILEKYYKAFISLLNNNGINIGTIITRETGREINDIPLPVQIDMVAFNQTCLDFIEYLEHVLEQIYEGQSNSNEKKIDFITRLVSRFIFEIENSLAMYNLMDRITNGWFVREMQIYLNGFKRPNSSQDDIPREIAVGSSTEKLNI